MDKEKLEIIKAIVEQNSMLIKKVTEQNERLIAMLEADSSGEEENPLKVVEEDNEKVVELVGKFEDRKNQDKETVQDFFTEVMAEDNLEKIQDKVDVELEVNMTESQAKGLKIAAEGLREVSRLIGEGKMVLSEETVEGLYGMFGKGLVRNPEEVARVAELQKKLRRVCKEFREKHVNQETKTEESDIFGNNA